MLKSLENVGFQPINRAYNSVFRPNRLSLGLVVPIEAYSQGPVPTMIRQLERIQLAEKLGFSAVWLRDVPFNVPSFGDAGQTYDPFVYLGLLAGQTERIALGVASIILPLRHPAHVAKAAATVDQLSGGRLILGVASGDRPEEYPALNHPFAERGDRFRESFDYIRQMGENVPNFDNDFGRLNGGMDMLPKPVSEKLPLLITGSSQQDPDWIARSGDGWMTYPRNLAVQAQIIRDWRTRVGTPAKPVMQPLYIDLTENPEVSPHPIHLGFRLGVNSLRTYLKSLEQIGINHVALNLRFNQTDIETTLKRLADDILPEFLE
ncbi:MAG: LLM class oxidoreductase [Cyanobacteria bacterium P01_B01_bin.77]